MWMIYLRLSGKYYQFMILKIKASRGLVTSQSYPKKHVKISQLTALTQRHFLSLRSLLFLCTFHQYYLQVRPFNFRQSQPEHITLRFKTTHRIQSEQPFTVLFVCLRSLFRQKIMTWGTPLHFKRQGKYQKNPTNGSGWHPLKLQHSPQLIVSFHLKE